MELSFIGNKKGLMEYIGEQICEFCLGTGEVDTMEQVYPGEPHYAPIGTEKCICQIVEDEYDNQ